MRIRRRAALVSLVALATGAPGCGRSPEPVAAIRLVDAFKPELVQGRAAEATAAPPRTEWRFDGKAAPEPATAWKAGPGVSDLSVRSGRLAGRSTAAVPILHVERTKEPDDPDPLDSIEVRLRVSAGTNLSVRLDGSETLDLKAAVTDAQEFPWDFQTPLIPGTEMRSYVLRSPFAVSRSSVRHVLLRPTDVAGGSFEIESVRLVFRRERLAEVKAGIGWHGLSEIHRETLVSRVPETIRMTVTLPPRPWLDLAVGTIEDGPVKFVVGVRATDGRADELKAEKTVTRPQRWTPAPVDLGPLGGRRVELSLSLSAEKSGALGFWGSPVVRSRVAGSRAGPPAKGERPQGVIVIWADTLRRDHLDVYGYPRPTAPNLRRMAQEGTLFRDCVVQATWTKVSTPSLLTSLYPSSHGVKDFSDRLPSSATTLAEVYRQAGYATVAMSSVIFIGHFSNLHQGFEELHEAASLPDQSSSKTAREYVDRLVPWLEAHRDVPFFVLLHVTDPHDPYKPPPPYDAMWADPSRTREHEQQAKDVRKFIDDALMKRFGMPNRAELARAGLDPEKYVGHERDWYDGSIRGMDAEIGRLMESLQSLGLAGRTLVMFTGDHGEEFLEHGRMFHGQTTYGELGNVPLIFWDPGLVPAGAVVEETVANIDLMPTLLELFRLPLPAGVQGQSLIPLLRPASFPDTRKAWKLRPAITEKAATIEPVGGPPPRDQETVALISGEWKLVHNVRRPDGAPEYELYDRSHDLLDGRDVAPGNPDVVKRLSSELDAWRRKALAARLPPDTEAAKALGKEELERLRSLGYIQ